MIVKAILRDWSIRAIFLDIFDRRGKSSEFVVDAWKKEDIEYKGWGWNLYYNLARVCLTDTIVSEVLESVGEAGVDDSMMANLLTRSTYVMPLSKAPFVFFFDKGP